MPQKLKSICLNGCLSRTMSNFSRSASVAPVCRSTTSDWVENAPPAYEWPDTNTVRPATVPSLDTRTRLGGYANDAVATTHASPTAASAIHFRRSLGVIAITWMGQNGEPYRCRQADEKREYGGLEAPGGPDQSKQQRRSETCGGNGRRQ